MSPTDRHEVADLVVVGGSVGGLAMAIGAADQGGRIVLIESAKTLGGGAALQPEHLAIAGSAAQRAAGIDDGPTTLLADLEAETHHHLDPSRAAAVVESGPAIEAWVRDRLRLDVELAAGSRYRGHSRARLHTLGGAGGGALVEALTSAVSKHHRIRVVTNVSVSGLSTESGTVTGVTIESKRRSDPLTVAGPVALACGGHAANDALVAEGAPDLASIPPRGAETATGRGAELARSVGARLDALGSFLVTGLLGMPSTIALDPVVIWSGAVLVNQTGRRFIEETALGTAVGRAVHEQPGHVAYLLFSDDIAAHAQQTTPFLSTVALPKSVRRSDTLGDLARQFGMDDETLTRTIDTYNANIDLGGDPFGRTQALVRITPRFHAARVTASRWRSLGGIAIDASARVLGTAGAPIPGLYAVGGATGGLGQGGPADEMPGIATLISLGTARLAAATWAADRPAGD